jgi:hypothetical protein
MASLIKMGLGTCPAGYWRSLYLPQFFVQQLHGSPRIMIQIFFANDMMNSVADKEDEEMDHSTDRLLADRLR